MAISWNNSTKEITGTGTMKDVCTAINDSSQMEALVAADGNGEYGVYQVKGAVHIGDDSTSTTITSKNDIIFIDTGIDAFDIKDNASLILGELAGSYGIDGSVISYSPSGSFDIIASGDSGAVFTAYDSTLINRAEQYIQCRDGTVTLFNTKIRCDSTSKAFIFRENCTLHLKNIYASSAGFLGIYVVPSTFENVSVHNCVNGITQNASGTVTVDGARVTNASTADWRQYHASGVLVAKDPVNPVGSPLIQNNGGIIKEQYTCNIKVTDNNGLALSGVTVVCRDKDGNQVFNTTTDVNGDIAEQVINYKQWVDTSETLTTYSPHKFVLIKAGYQSLTIDNITVDDPIVWNLELQPAGGIFTHLYE